MSTCFSALLVCSLQDTSCKHCNIPLVSAKAPIIVLSFFHNDRALRRYIALTQHVASLCCWVCNRFCKAANACRCFRSLVNAKRAA